MTLIFSVSNLVEYIFLNKYTKIALFWGSKMGYYLSYYNEKNFDLEHLVEVFFVHGGSFHGGSMDTYDYL